MKKEFASTFVVVLVAGTLCAQTNTFPTSGNVGIGTTTPSEKLSVQGTGSIGAEIVTDGASTSRPFLGFFRGTGFWHVGMNMNLGNSDNFHFRYNGSSYPFTIQASTGNVGIGTTSPAHLLEIHSDNNPTLSIGKLNQNTSGISTLYFFAGTATHKNSFTVQYIKDAANDRLRFIDGGLVEVLSIRKGGNVGIGTVNPDARLTVKGSIHAEEVKVDLNVPPPDYVFEPGYNLLPLSDLGEYVGENKHLPGIPSGDEMQKNGILLMEMNMLLLKKVEELTLYMIQMDQENQILKSKVELLENRIIDKRH